MLQTHGGDWAAFEEEYGHPPLDFSASVSPFGLPEGVREAVMAALERAERYPDPRCTALRRAIGETLGVDAGRIVCGAGAAELIHRLCQCEKPKTALLPEPGFSEYRRALEAVDCTVYTHVLTAENGFVLTERILGDITPGLSLLVLCQPNNPTGRCIEPGLLRRILMRCGETGTRLLLDECFVDFLDAPEACSLLPALEESEALVLLRAFTKSHGLAGLRLGYALCGSEELARRLAGTGQPWPVSQLAQAAGIAALRDSAYLPRLQAWLRTERPILARGLAALGLRVVPGEGNFLLFQAGDGRLAERMRKKGVLIRDCRDFHGLEPGWYRVAVRTHGENEALLQALKEVLDG